MCGANGDSARVRLLLLTLRVVPTGRAGFTARSMFTSPVASKLEPNQMEATEEDFYNIFQNLTWLFWVVLAIKRYAPLLWNTICLTVRKPRKQYSQKERITHAKISIRITLFLIKIWDFRVERTSNQCLFRSDRVSTQGNSAVWKIILY